MKWEYERTESKAFPFRATVTAETGYFATVSHASKDEAQRDDQFYRFNGTGYFPTAAGYQEAVPIKSVETIKLIYDKSSEIWRTQSTSEQRVPYR